MKRSLKLALLLVFLVLTFSIISFAADPAEPITGKAGENITWSLDDKGVLTFTGTGDMPNYNWYENKSPWYVHRFNVKTVVVSEGITSVGACAFKDATSLVNVTLPAGIKTIGKEAFYGCISIKAVELPEIIEELGNGAFRGCTLLKNVTLPSTLKIIGENAFYGCETLTKINLPEGLVEIRDNSFFGCRGLGDITIPSTVKTVEKRAFSSCTKLRFITMTTGLMYIEEEAFSGCVNIGTLTFPESLENIGKNAFKGSTGITRLTFPESLITISSGAFDGCNNIVAITYNGTSEQWSQVRKGIYNTPLTNVKISCKGDSIPKVLGYGECGDNLKWEFNDRYTLIITGTGDMDNYKLNGPNAPWYPVRPYIRKVQLSEGITSIGDFAFRDCTEIQTIVVPDSVTRIGDYAFSNCRIAQSITMPKNLLTIGKNAFRDCTALASINLPSTLTSIGENAFYKCREIKEVIIPDSVTSVGQDAFIYCTSLEKVTLGNGVSVVRPGTFRGTAITNLRIPANLRYINEGAFEGCTGPVKLETFHTEQSWKEIKISENNDVIVNAEMFYRDPNADITITLDSVVVDCEKYGQKATIVDGRTLVPLRAIFEALSATVEWDDETKTVTSTLGETVIKLTIGEPTLYKNDVAVTLDVPAMLINSRTMVPARAVAESFGVNVAWDNYTRTVVLTKPAA